MNPEKLRLIAFAPAGGSEAGSGDSETTGPLAQARQSVGSTARETAARLKSMASGSANRARSEAQHLAAEKKQDAAERIRGYGAAVHESAKSLEPQDPNIAWATHQIADRIQGFSDYIRESDFDELKTDIEGVARRHPVAFFGGLFIAGLIIGNLLKAHQPEDEPTGGEENWDEGNARGSADPRDITAPKA